MLKTKKRSRRKSVRRPLPGKLALAAAAIVIIKLTGALGGEQAAESAMRRIAESGETVTEILSIELGGDRRADALSVMSGQSALLDEITHLTVNSDEPDDTGEISESAPPVDIIRPTEHIPQVTAGEYYEYVPDASGVKLKNTTDYDIDPQELISGEPDVHIDPSSPQVLIIHTHGSEAYMPDGKDVYAESDPSRTEDKSYNVIRVGDRLCELLEQRGISVLHDRELYDYPSYTGSYSRSMEAIERYREEYPDIKVVLDLHRDAIENEDGTVHRTAAEIDGETCSQVLLICGTDYSGLYHPDWRENLKFALHLQADMDEKYPGLTRPLKISQYRYNQQATHGSLIVEVGCTGNTLQESLKAVELFGDCLGDVLLRFAQK